MAADEKEWTRARLRSLRNEVQSLKGRVGVLEEELRRQQARNSFMCSDASTSANGAGGTEDCEPFACNHLDGRCFNYCDTSDRCAPGFLCDTGRRVCVPPPPPSNDDSCWPF